MTPALSLILRAAFLVLALGAPPAWADASTTPPATISNNRKATAPKPRFVVAPQKHNGSGITMSYHAPEQLKPGVAATVQIKFTRVTSSDAQVELHAQGSELQVTRNGHLITGPMALEVGKAQLIEVQVTGSEGMHYLSVFTRQHGRSSTQGIALKVGQGAIKLKPNGTVQTTPSGERVISLPSQ
jgi:hypothetical protein